MNRKISSKEKGNILEDIVAKIYKEEGDIVKKNVYLKPISKHTKKRKKREIDILIIKRIAGIEVKIAIECKNKEKPIGSPDIDAFIGKLNDVGIPTQMGIFISTSGFREGASERAKDAGITPLVLNDVSEIDNLNNTLEKAIQFTVFLLLSYNRITITNKHPHSEDVQLFFDSSGKVCGTIFDLIRHNWLKGNIPEEIGNHDIELIIPDGWRQIIEGREVPIISAEANVNVYGLLL